MGIFPTGQPFLCVSVCARASEQPLYRPQRDSRSLFNYDGNKLSDPLRPFMQDNLAPLIHRRRHCSSSSSGGSGYACTGSITCATTKVLLNVTNVQLLRLPRFFFHGPHGVMPDIDSRSSKLKVTWPKIKIPARCICVFGRKFHR